MVGSNEKNVVFAIGESPDGVPTILCGITQEAWDIMQSGKSSDMDLTKAGYPFRLILFGGKDHAEIMNILTEAAEHNKTPLKDMRDKDFSIKKP